MINGVLVERTVKDVIPALRTNSDGLKQVLDELLVQYKSKQDEMDKWKVRTTISELVLIAYCVVEKEQGHCCTAISTDLAQNDTTNVVVSTKWSLT